MITVISGTNRPNSKTEIIAKYYFEALKSESNEDIRFYSLQDMPTDLISSTMYEEEGQHPGITKVQDEILIPADKWVLVLPEYNGSYPGIFKLFIDAVSIRKYAETFKKKKMGLIGVASGRAGNLRGLDQLSNAMNYLGFNVMPQKLPLPLIKSKTDETSITDDFTKETLTNHAKMFHSF